MSFLEPPPTRTVSFLQSKAAIAAQQNDSFRCLSNERINNPASKALVVVVVVVVFVF